METQINLLYNYLDIYCPLILLLFLVGACLFRLSKLNVAIVFTSWLKSRTLVCTKYMLSACHYSGDYYMLRKLSWYPNRNSTVKFVCMHNIDPVASAVAEL